MTLLRRFLVIAGLLFWQGGFLFYASAVVPVAQEVIGHRQQGFITRQVTEYLNWSGFLALIPLGWDVLAAREGPIGRNLRVTAWLGMAGTLAYLFWLHPQLDALLDPATLRVLDPPLFRTGHRWYLWVSTAQWLFGLLYMGLMLHGWRMADAQQKTHEA